MVNVQSILDLRLAAGLSERWSASASLPWVYGTWSVPLPLVPRGHRFQQDSRGIGDLVLAPRFWVLDPSENPRGNLQAGLGLKIPTGDPGVEDLFPDVTGRNLARRPVDVSIQPGDGGWGPVLDLFAYRDAGPVRLFATGTYLCNPRETNDTLSTPSALLGPASVPARIRRNSVPDQSLAQVGAAVPLVPGLGASLALRWEGVPARDLLGGNEGWRRPGYTVSLAPGLSWTLDRTTVSLSVPVTTRRNRMNDASGAGGDATFADWSVILGLTVRF